MKIPLCHHYWQNGQDARWSPGEFPVPEMERTIKNDYLFLQKERPACRQYGQYTVFFDYRPAKDVFGREIVPISFAFLKNSAAAPDLAPKIRKALAAAPVGQFFLDIPAGEEEKERAPKNLRKKLRKITGFVLIAIFLLLIARCALAGAPF